MQLAIIPTYKKQPSEWGKLCPPARIQDNRYRVYIAILLLLLFIDHFTSLRIRISVIK